MPWHGTCPICGQLAWADHLFQILYIGQVLFHRSFAWRKSCQFFDFRQRKQQLTCSSNYQNGRANWKIIEIYGHVNFRYSDFRELRRPKKFWKKSLKFFWLLIWKNCFKFCCLLKISDKGQMISKCLFGVIVWTKKPTNFFPGFLP